MSDILKQKTKDKINKLGDIDNDFNIRIRDGKYPALEECLFEWIMLMKKIQYNLRQIDILNQTNFNLNYIKRNTQINFFLAYIYCSILFIRKINVLY